VIAYVMPSDDRSPSTTQFAVRSEPNSQPNRSAAPDRPLESPITELLAAIEAEQNRAERASQPPPQAQPVEPRRVVQQEPAQQAPEPRRIVQQTSEPAPQTSVRAGADNPAIAQLLGLKARAQVPSLAAPPRPAPQRERQVQQDRPNRVARGDSGLAGAFSFR
jgi:hypothetical protein